MCDNRGSATIVVGNYPDMDNSLVEQCHTCGKEKPLGHFALKRDRSAPTTDCLECHDRRAAGVCVPFSELLLQNYQQVEPWLGQYVHSPVPSETVDLRSGHAFGACVLLMQLFQTIVYPGTYGTMFAKPLPIGRGLGRGPRKYSSVSPRVTVVSQSQNTDDHSRVMRVRLREPHPHSAPSNFKRAFTPPCASINILPLISYRYRAS